MKSQLLIQHWKGTNRTKYFLVLAALLLLALLFFSSPLKPEIEAEILVRGLNASEEVLVVLDEGPDASSEWLSEEEALIRLTASRDAVIKLSVGGEEFPFTLHELIIFKTKTLSTDKIDLDLRMTGGKVVSWYDSILEEFHAVLYDNRFVVAFFVAFSIGFVFLRGRPRHRYLVPYWMILALLTYQALFFLNLTPTLYWDTPLSDPYVRTCLLAQFILSGLLVAVWLPGRKLLARSRPDLLGMTDRIIDKYGLIILILLPLLQHFVGHVIFGYNLQPPDARWVWLVWAERMLDKGIIAWLAGGTLKGLDPPMVSLLWAAMYRALRDKYLVSALLPMLFSEIAIVSTFFLARQLFERRLGFYAAFFLALSPLFAFQGYFVATDVPSVALASLTLCLFLAASRRDSIPLAVASGICLLLTAATKLTGLYCALLIVLVYLSLGRKGIRVLLITLSCLVLFPVLYLGPLLIGKGFNPTTVVEAGSQLWTWMKLAMFVTGKERPADWNYLLLQSGQVHHYMGPSSTFFYLQYMVNAVGFPIFYWGTMILIMLVEAWWRGLRDQLISILKDKVKLLLLAVWIFVLLLFLSPWLMRNTRFSYLAFPAYTILAGYGFLLFKKGASSEGSPHSNLLLLLTAVMLVTLSLAHYYSFPILVNHKYRDPLFEETADAHYCIHRHYGGWHVCWTGAGTSRHFAGELATDGRFVDIVPFDLERADTLEMSDSQDRITFQGSSRLGRDGFDLTIEEGTWISFDLRIDGARHPERVYIYTGSIAVRRDEATALPFRLLAD
jgi:4-amino-4-deoxy-L-arabinose transferase-like glycosyltransferase